MKQRFLLLGLLLAGFTLVALPLVGALAYSAWNTERLAGQSRSAVFNASEAARASRSLVDRIGTIERLAQQAAVLQDAEVFANYAKVHRSFRQLGEEISQLPLDYAQLWALNRTLDEEQGLYDLLTAYPRPLADQAEVAARLDPEARYGVWWSGRKAFERAMQEQPGLVQQALGRPHVLGHRRAGEALARVVVLYKAWGKPERAAEYAVKMNR